MARFAKPVSNSTTESTKNLAEEIQAGKRPKFGPCADRLLDIGERRAVLNGQLKLLDEEESTIENYLIDNLPKSDSRGISGLQATALIKTKNVPIAKDWDKFYAFVLKTKDFSLLHKKLSTRAIEERWEAKQTVPGIDVMIKKSVSITAIKKG